MRFGLNIVEVTTAELLGLPSLLVLFTVVVTATINFALLGLPLFVASEGN
jgi:hypothetical protein